MKMDLVKEMTTHMVKPYPSSLMKKAQLKNVDLSKYNHNSDCECKDCGGDCPLDM
jgi:hypothetical protein